MLVEVYDLMHGSIKRALPIIFYYTIAYMSYRADREIIFNPGLRYSFCTVSLKAENVSSISIKYQNHCPGAMAVRHFPGSSTLLKVLHRF
jgi:hypothetical protein